MSRLDDLPPDQHATLSLLLSKRKSYAEVAALLGISERAVHDRAQVALAVLAPDLARKLTAERRAEIGNYLLGQQASVAQRLSTRTYLESSAPARAWANAISADILPLSTAPLPEIPNDPAPPDPALHASAAEAPPADHEPSPQPAGRSGWVRGQYPQPSSRLGGALLLGAIVAVIVAVVLIAGGGGGSHTASTTAASSNSATSSTPSTATSTSGGPTEDQRLALTSPDPANKAAGVVEILSEGGKHAFYLAAEHLPPSHGFFYAVWLYNSPSSHEALSKSPPVGANGRLQGGALLPANAGEYHTMLLTRETSERPSHPGPVVLSGPFSLGG